MASTQTFQLSGLSKKELADLSRKAGWSLSGDEMAAVQAHFAELGRDPTDVEVETIAQTWSEHCKHKTFTSPVVYREGGKTRRFENFIKETIFEVTRKLDPEWCWSVFKDNAGIVEFEKDWGVAFKVETHNHPCAIEPYGGAQTGVGGVIRDILGVGLGAKPVASTDVFCFGDLKERKDLPEGVLHPKRTMRQVVSGVRDYGNRMGIPTVGGAVYFDPEYLYNPLVFVGTLGLIPKSKIEKKVRPGDFVVAFGGATGRDGLHGATFSSAEIDADTDSSAVQIGHAIMEKRVLDALLEARELGLYRGLTDCGAGGFSSAVGELGEETGVEVELGAARLKHQGMLPWEIWLSESQERMVAAVPPAKLARFKKLLSEREVEFDVLGRFTRDKTLTVRHNGERVAALSMAFLHDGLPKRELQARWRAPKLAAPRGRAVPPRQMLRRLLGHLNIASKEWVVRQYDHEVQAGTVVKPFVGAAADGPSDAAVVWPGPALGEAGSWRGVAVAHGLNPLLGKVDPHAMGGAVVDEALRNLVAVGADPSRAAVLDNYCWGDPKDPDQLGALVRATLGAMDAALAHGTPFISGKDSLNNTYRDRRGRLRNIPGTLLISAIAPVPDVRRAVTMDFKGTGRAVYVIGTTRADLEGTHYRLLGGVARGGVAAIDHAANAKAYRRLHAALAAGFARSCHDLSEGGLAVALAESAFSGGWGARIDLTRVPGGLSDDAALFSESPGRFLVEVDPVHEADFLEAVAGSPAARLGYTMAEGVLQVRGRGGNWILDESLSDLKREWKDPLPRWFDGAPEPARQEAAR